MAGDIIAPEVFVTPCPAPRRIARRADHVRKVEKRITHREVAMPRRLHPPCVDVGEKVRMGDKMRVERSLIDDLATRDVDAWPVRVCALCREAVAALPALSAPSAPPISQPAVVPRLSIVVLPVLSPSSLPAISFCNL
jgi:hypothetical protein